MQIRPWNSHWILYLEERPDEDSDMGYDLLWIRAWGYGWMRIRWNGLGFAWTTIGLLKKKKIMMMI